MLEEGGRERSFCEEYPTVVFQYQYVQDFHKSDLNRLKLSWNPRKYPHNWFVDLEPEIRKNPRKNIPTVDFPLIRNRIYTYEKHSLPKVHSVSEHQSTEHETLFSADPKTTTGRRTRAPNILRLFDLRCSKDLFSALPKKDKKRKTAFF